MKNRGLVLMCSVCFVLIQAAGVCFAGPYVKPASQREKICINQDWKYMTGDITGAEQTNFNDASWGAISIPHSFSIPYWQEGIMAGNDNKPAWGWYRKKYSIPQAWSTRRVFVEFEAAFQRAWVYVNGSLVGEHKGGYTAFCFDITDKVTFGSDNVIAVRLSAAWDKEITPLAGEHQFSGGIYRDVHLTSTAPAHVTFYGTHVRTPWSTPVRSDGNYTGPTSFPTAPVSVKTEVKNAGQAAKSYTVKSIIVDADNQIVDSSMKSSNNIAAGATYTFAQTTTVNSPKMWSPANPYMYRVYTEVYDGATVLDTYESPLGIRCIQWTGAQGFYINGQHLWLHGFNVHQDHAGWCDAVAQTGAYRDVWMCKKAGNNIIRGSHYPHSQAFSDACDKLGIIFWQEFPIWGIGGCNGATNWSYSYAYYGSAGNFEANTKAMLAEMVRQHRNHPSIGVWSLGNEYTYTQSSQLTPLKAFVTELNKMVKAEDSLFATACGMGYGDCPASQLAPLVDVSGYNGDGLGVTNPGKPNLMSEFNNGGGRSRPNSASLGANEGTQYAWRSGAILWCGFNHGSNRGMGSMGIIDNDRIPQRTYFTYCQTWGGMTLPTFAVSGTGTKVQLFADVYTNPSVTFQHNNNITVKNNGTEDVMLVARIVDGSGAWINQNVQVTLTAPTGAGKFATGSTLTRAAPWGMLGAEFHVSSKPGPVTITASAPGMESSSITFTVQDNPVAIHEPNVTTLNQQGKNRLSVKQASFGQGVRVFYAITGEFSASKQPVLNIYAMDGSLIGQVPLKDRTGVVELDNQKMHLPSGVIICRLMYGGVSAEVKSIMLR